MEYMTLDEVRDRAGPIRQAFEQLHGKKHLIVRPHSAQWRFLRLCVERTLGTSSDVACWSANQLAQYKYQIEACFQAYYGRGGEPVDFVFQLVSTRDAVERGWIDNPDSYPCIGGYHLMIRDRSFDAWEMPGTRRQQCDLIEKVISEAIAAEFRSYLRLPEIDLTDLGQWFSPDGSAYAEIRDVLLTKKRYGLVLTNPMNPSTYRVQKFRVRDYCRDKATVSTMEYMYLRWWSLVENKYHYPYREIYRSTYYLLYKNNGWLIDGRSQPTPRSSTPNRLKKVRQS